MNSERRRSPKFTRASGSTTCEKILADGSVKREPVIKWSVFDMANPSRYGQPLQDPLRQPPITTRDSWRRQQDPRQAAIVSLTRSVGIIIYERGSGHRSRQYGSQPIFLNKRCCINCVSWRAIQGALLGSATGCSMSGTVCLLKERLVYFFYRVRLPWNNSQVVFIHVFGKPVTVN